MATSKQIREGVQHTLQRMRWIADLAEQAAAGPEPEQAAYHLHDFLSEYRSLVQPLPRPTE